MRDGEMVVMVAHASWVAPWVGKRTRVARSRGPGIGGARRASTPAEASVAWIASAAVSVGRVRAGSRTTW